jgi:hypothetical protein
VRTITADDVLRVIETSLPRFDGSVATAATARVLDQSKSVFDMVRCGRCGDVTSTVVVGRVAGCRRLAVVTRPI